MGLFSKPNEDKVFELFNALTPEQQEAVKTKLVGKIEEKKEDPKTEVEPKEEAKVEEAKAELPKAETDKKEEPKEPSFEEIFKTFITDNDKKIEAMRKEYDEKLDKLVKREPEKKPFGLSENSKEYKATYKPQETSDEYIKRLFKK